MFLLHQQMQDPEHRLGPNQAKKKNTKEEENEEEAEKREGGGVGGVRYLFRCVCSVAVTPAGFVWTREGRRDRRHMLPR